MRSSTALLLAVALSASAIPLPRKDTRQAKLALREPDVVNVWKHRHFDAAVEAAQRRDEGHPDRHSGHGDGHWTRRGTWLHSRTGPMSNSKRHGGEEGDAPRHGRHGRKGCGGGPPGDQERPTGPPEGQERPTGPPGEQEHPDEPSPPPPTPPAEQQPPADAPADKQLPADPPVDQPPPADAPAASGNANAQAYLDPHNAARARWNAGPVNWDDKLAELAQKWVDGCTFEHSGGSLTSEFGYGENLAAGTGEQDIAGAVSGWVDEEKAWNPSNPVFSMETGHFTQVVWKGTTTIGCAYKDCPSSTGPFGDGYGPTWRLHSCMYTPPGNFGGEYEKNVG